MVIDNIRLSNCSAHKILTDDFDTTEWPQLVPKLPAHVNRLNVVHNMLECIKSDSDFLMIMCLGYMSLDPMGVAHSPSKSFHHPKKARNLCPVKWFT